MNIRFSGFGGQGIVLAGVLCGQAAILDGKNAVQTQSYGSESRGGSCRSDVVISDEEICELFSPQVDILIAMSQPAYDTYSCDVREGGVIFHDEELVKPNTQLDFSHFSIPATRRAVEVFDNRLVANTILLAAVVEATGIVTSRALLLALEKTIDKKYLEINKKAIELGFDLGSTVKNY